MATFPRKNLMILAALEVPILGGAALRFVTAQQNGETSPQLVPWMVVTCLAAGLSVSVHQVLLLPHMKGPDPIPDEARRRALSISLTMLGAAALLCAAGPKLFELILGAGAS